MSDVKPLHKYTQRALEKFCVAKRRLEETEDPLSKVAKDAGYGTQQAFTLVFSSLTEKIPVAEGYDCGAIPPSAYRRSQKPLPVIMQAQHMLLYTDMPVAEISEFLTFNTRRNFLRKFKDHTGQTPTEFRVSAREEVASEFSALKPAA